MDVLLILPATGNLILAGGGSVELQGAVAVGGAVRLAL